MDLFDVLDSSLRFVCGSDSDAASVVLRVLAVQEQDLVVASSGLSDMKVDATVVIVDSKDSSNQTEMRDDAVIEDIAVQTERVLMADKSVEVTMILHNEVKVEPHPKSPPKTISAPPQRQPSDDSSEESGSDEEDPMVEYRPAPTVRESIQINTEYDTQERKRLESISSLSRANLETEVSSVAAAVNDKKADDDKVTTVSDGETSSDSEAESETSGDGSESETSESDEEVEEVKDDQNDGTPAAKTEPVEIVVDAKQESESGTESDSDPESSSSESDQEPPAPVPLVPNVPIAPVVPIAVSPEEKVKVVAIKETNETNEKNVEEASSVPAATGRKRVKIANLESIKVVNGTPWKKSRTENAPQQQLATPTSIAAVDVDSSSSSSSSSSSDFESEPEVKAGKKRKAAAAVKTTKKSYNIMKQLLSDASKSSNADMAKSSMSTIKRSPAVVVDDTTNERSEKKNNNNLTEPNTISNAKSYLQEKLSKSHKFLKARMGRKRKSRSSFDDLAKDQASITALMEKIEKNPEQLVEIVNNTKGNNGNHNDKSKNKEND